MKIPRNLLVIFLSGTVKFQAGWLVLEIALLNALFCQNPKVAAIMGHFDTAPSPRSFYVLTCLGLLFIMGGIFTGWQQVKFLQTGKVVSGRALNVKADNSGEDTRYNLRFEYMDDDGRQQTIGLERDHDGIAVGETVPMVIGENGNRALVEHDLAGGLTLANLINAEPVSPQCVLRVIVIPLLTVVTLLFWQPAVAAFVQRIVESGFSGIILVPLILQVVWILFNKRYFVISITEICVCGGEKCDREYTSPKKGFLK